MKRTNRQKIDFILNYSEDFDMEYLLEDLLAIISDEQLDLLFDQKRERNLDYQEEYIDAWYWYSENKDYYKKQGQIEKYDESIKTTKHNVI